MGGLDPNSKFAFRRRHRGKDRVRCSTRGPDATAISRLVAFQLEAREREDEQGAKAREDEEGGNGIRSPVEPELGRRRNWISTPL
eukprot:3704188-Pyramimonas_sp.AAC.1